MTQTSPRFLLRLVSVLVIVFVTSIMLIGLAYLFAVISSELVPGIKIVSLDVDQVSVSTSHQLVLRLRVEVRAGCVGRVARGYVRPTPGVPDSMDIQLMTEAAMPLGLSLEQISGRLPTLSATAGAVSARHNLITVREFIPSPNTLEPGGGWRFAEFLSQEGCGVFHGLLPITTTIALGPPVSLGE